KHVRPSLCQRPPHLCGSAPLLGIFEAVQNEEAHELPDPIVRGRIIQVRPPHGKGKSLLQGDRQPKSCRIELHAKPYSCVEGMAVCTTAQSPGSPASFPFSATPGLLDQIPIATLFRGPEPDNGSGPHGTGRITLEMALPLE